MMMMMMMIGIGRPLRVSGVKFSLFPLLRWLKPLLRSPFVRQPVRACAQSRSLDESP